MFKNIVIGALLAALAFCGLWAHLYQRRVDQIFLTYNINMLANDSRLFIRVAQRIESGQPEEAKKILRNVAQTNVGEIKTAISKLDPGMDDLVSDARNAGKLLEEIGEPEVSRALEAHLKSAQE
jgi:hypothetical protein